MLFSADPRRYVVISFFGLFFSMQVFSISNGKSWIGVLVVAVALGGSSSSCQKRQSTPKNEPQRSTETPNGKGKEVYSGSDSPESSGSGEEHGGDEITPVTSGPGESHRSTSGNSPDGTDESEQKGSGSSQSDVPEIPEELLSFVKLESGRLVINRECSLREDKEVKGLGEGTLSVLSAFGYEFLFQESGESNSDKIQGRIEVTLLKVRGQTGNGISFMLIVVGRTLDGGSLYRLEVFKDLSEVEGHFGRFCTSSLEEYAIDRARRLKRKGNVPLLDPKGLFSDEYLVGHGCFFKYGEDGFLNSFPKVYLVMNI